MNVRSVSKLSAAVMTLAVLSYCGKKSHDSASLASANRPLSCQTADEIRTHVINADHKAEAFCFHKVEHPAVTLIGGEAISDDMQLKQDLDVAFLNVQKNFADAQRSCASLGAGWHAPLSNNQYATPQAAGNSNSLEAVGSYFKGISGVWAWFWSSSTVSGHTSKAWGVVLANGYTSGLPNKNSSDSVVCVKP